MFYYLVWVRSQRYHGTEPLTYSSSKRLPVGSLIEVELQNLTVPGFISGLTTKPRFQVKEIKKIFALTTLPSTSIKLLSWLTQYYPAPLGIATQQLLPANINDTKADLANLNINHFLDPPAKVFPPLTNEQKNAFTDMVPTDTYLLHGRTGSGKTRLYIELAAATIKQGRSVIILTPEISLTSQLASNFKNTFGERVIVLHSRQTPKQRRIAWLSSLMSTEPRIVIGPRSALFAPLKTIGLIVIDESHENAYKQSQSPEYQTGRVAAQLAKLAHASLILGSATPSISDYYLATQKHKPIVELTKLAKPKVTPVSVQIIDRKDQQLFNRSPFLSQPLIEAVSAALSNSQQALLYLNRRGTARLVMCNNCGWQATCPHCDIPLTYHGDKHIIRCHSCSYQQVAPGSCPSCGNPDITFKTAGTKAIVDDVKRLFSGAKVARFDTDNSKAESFEQNYEAVRDGKVDILVGTQMIAKGVDLPHLSVVGVLLADTSLYIPDFTADERTFQLISQVLGRIGRGHIAGHAIIQTYHPDSQIIKQAVNNDYKSFYDTELLNRSKFLFPPFCYLLKLTIRRANPKTAESSAEQFKGQLYDLNLKIAVEGPAPSFYERVNGKYEWQLIIKAKERGELIRVIDHLPANWSYDIDPIDLM